jgi:hypothetical protein
MMADGKVVVPPDSSGKSIDTSELTRSDGTVVERQRVVIGDATNVTSLGSVSPEGALTVSMQLDNIESQLARIARLLEILVDVEVPLGKA